VEISASRAEKSFGSSAGAAAPFDEEACCCDLDSSRAALPPFLWRWGVVVKERRVGGGERVVCFWEREVVGVRVEACLIWVG
jgi:hypothetical protein